MVGMGLAPPETVAAALAPDDGSSAGGPAGGGAPKSELRRRGVVGPTLPPERLSLEHVEYEHEHGLPLGSPLGNEHRPVASHES